MSVLAAVPGQHTLPEPLCTVLYFVWVIALIIAVVLLIVDLVASRGRPMATRWITPAVVALVAFLISVLFC